MKLFEKLKAKSCYRTSPVEHIYQSFVTENPYYDDLYENQNRQQHETWINFRNELQMPCVLSSQTTTRRACTAGLNEGEGGEEEWPCEM